MPSPLRNRKVLLGGGLFTLLLLVALWPSSVPADLAEVSRGHLRVSVDEEGETRIRDRFVVSAPLAGRVLRIELEPGDPVVRGETVVATFQPGDPALLDSRARAEAEAQVKASEAGLGRARAEHQRAQADRAYALSELERHRRLAEQDIVSADRLEVAELSARTAEEGLRAAEFAVRSAEYQLEMARARLLQTGGGAGKPIVIRSPIDGQVLRRFRESEAVVPAGEPLLELGDPADLEIVSDMLSSDAVRIEAGDPVLIEQWGGDRPLNGRVRRVEPAGFTKISALGVEEQRVNVVVDIEDPVETWTALGDAYRVEVRVVVWEAHDVVKVPTSSLFRRSGEWAVFAVEGGRARLRIVELGQRNGLEAEVRSGLAEGDLVVAHPSDVIDDGVRVTRRE